jgi:thiol-disulfide isomerase/thioredoxin
MTQYRSAPYGQLLHWPQIPMWRLSCVLLLAFLTSAQTPKEIEARVSALRSTPDDQRGEATRKLALDIRALPASADHTQVAANLAMLSTEGDFGQATLQEVANTLADALRTTPAKNDMPYQILAELERLEHVTVKLDAPPYAAAKAKLQKAADARTKVDFTLNDLNGRTWKLSGLRGKVVVVNFWATWCPPCRKEMPDLDALAHEFPSDLVILGLTDEEPAIARKYLAEHPYRYPILLDAAGKVKKAFGVDAIPKSFFYTREGKIAAESIDMRTMRQFRALLAQAGLK